MTPTFSALLLIAGLLMIAALFNSGQLVNTVHWNTHTYKVLKQSERMLLNMVNIETGLRGYSHVRRQEAARWQTKQKSP